MLCRFALIRDSDVPEVYQTRFPEIITEGRMIGTEVDFGDLTNDQEIVFKVTIDIYRHI